MNIVQNDSLSAKCLPRMYVGVAYIYYGEAHWDQRSGICNVMNVWEIYLHSPGILSTYNFCILETHLWSSILLARDVLMYH